MLRKQQAPRPFSRLDNFDFDNEPANQEVVAVGIPEKLMSASKAFPPVEDQENVATFAPKKREKAVNASGNGVAEYCRGRILSEVSNVMRKMEEKIAEPKAKVKAKPNLSTVAQQLVQPAEVNCPVSDQSQKEERDKKGSKGARMGFEEKSMARRVRERMEAENLKREQRRRKHSIGEEAYLPYNLKELREKISMRSRISSHKAAN